MPRIPPRILRIASRESRLLPHLLPACRTLESARQELRWIKAELPQNEWHLAVQKRSQLVPLQYILGSQPFGEIEIKCRSGVLIPRWETEEWVGALGDCLKSLHVKLRIMDVCTGTGCIALGLASILDGKDVEVRALDVSAAAVDLARENVEGNGISNVEIHQGDLFETRTASRVVGESWNAVDLITSNPPYIPLRDYKSAEIERSVKLHEPELALVGDTSFYDALVMNFIMGLNADSFIFELGYASQFEYVKLLIDELSHNRNEMWECWLRFDGAGKERCVIGYKKGTNMEVLESMRQDTKLEK